MKKQLVLSLILTLCCLPLIGQDYVGQVRGTVSDETGGVIPGVELTALNADTGVAASSVSGDAGDYTFQSLSIGTYTVTASLAGFKTVEQVGVRVVSSETSVLNITLPIGELVDTVTVEGGALAIDSQSSSAGTTRVVEEIEELPMAVNQGGRHSLSYTRTLPGFSYDPYGKETDTTDRGYIHGVVGVVSMNIDGMFASPANNFGMREDSGLIPETISEFRTVANVGAEHGWNLGSSVEMVMKSGTNQIHGSFFEYFRNDVLDAKQFFASSVNPHRQSEFGAVISGPFAKDKHFFLASYTGYRERRTAGGQTTTVPTSKMRGGDFSEYLTDTVLGTDLLGRTIYQGTIYDPLTTRSDGAGGFIRDPFPGNVIPAGRLSPISLAFQGGYPLPTETTLANNHIGQLDKGEQDIDKVTIKTDHEMSDNWKFSFGMDQHRKDVIWPGNASFDQRINTNHLVLGDQYRYRFANYFTIKPNVLLSVRFAGQGVPRYIGKPGNTFGKDSGLNGTVTPDTPWVAAEGHSSFGFLFLNLFMPEWTFPVYTDLSWSKGSHNYKFGAQMRYAAVGRNIQIFTNGNFTFSDITTGLAGGQVQGSGGAAEPFADIALTGRGWASYLLGEVNNFFMYSAGNSRTNNRVWAVYAQDSWRVSPKLTVNYGLRYNWWTPFGESHHRHGGFSPDIPNPGAGGRLGALTFNGPGAGRNGRTRLYDRDWSALGPRLGLAYALDDRTVVRAYVGVTYANPGAELQGGGNAMNLGWQARPGKDTLDGGVTPAFNWNDGVPTSAIDEVLALPSLDPAQSLGAGVEWNHPQDNKWHSSINLGAGFEREVGWNTVFKLDYVGKLGRHYRVNWQQNEIPPEYFSSLGPTLDASLASTEGQATGVATPYTGFTGSVGQALRPYPQYSGVLLRGAHGGMTSYHAANIAAQKRFGQGVSFLLAYTLSKNITTGSGYGVFGAAGVQHEGYGGANVRTLAPFDRTHNLAFTWSWQLPFGRGQKFAGDASGAKNFFVGDWRVMGWHNYMSGDPIRLARVNRTGSAYDKGIKHYGYDPNGSNKNTLNIDAFSAENRAISFGDTFQLPDTRKFGYATENFSILKDVRFSERWRFEIGAEMFNVFNRAQFYSPAYNLNDADAFGKYRNAALGRIIQIRVRIRF